MPITITVGRIQHWVSKNTLAFVDIVINGAITIKKFTVMKNKQGEAFVSVPSSKDKAGKFWKDVLFTKVAYEELQTSVLDAYNASIAK